MSSITNTSNDILTLKFQDEISIQVLAQFKLLELNYCQLQKIQQKIPIIYPWNNNYQLYRNNYNRRFTYFPMGIVKCKRSKDVQRSLKFVRKYCIQFSIRSGAHCYLPFSLSTGIIIDLFEMNTIKVTQTDESCKCETEIRSSKHVEIGPGSRLGVVIKELSPHSLSLPVGSCVNTCTAGLTLGGGISPSLIRLSGLMMDHLVRAKIILPDGDLIYADQKHHSDLYFALRGAGSCNFGIVTKLIFNPCKFKGAVVFNIQYPWSAIKEVMNMWQKFAPFTDRRLSTELDLYPLKFTPVNELPVQFKGQFEGSLEELENFISDFIKLAKKQKMCDNIYIKQIKTFAESGYFWGQTRQSYFENNSVFWLNMMSSTAIDVYIKFLEKAPGLGSSIEFNAMRGAVEDIKSDETAFPHRQALFWIQHRGTTVDPDQITKQQLWVNELYNAIIPYVEKSQNVVPSYVNAPQTNLTANNQFLTAYYGSNVKKLIEVKNKYDPENIFNFAQSIPLKK